MPPPSDVHVGPLTRTALDGARSRERSQFPASQEWADEVERVLAFLAAQDVLGRFLPRLRGRESQRDGALAEARVAYFFHCNGFSILSWEPEAVRGRPADLEIGWRATAAIVVEVKGPGWEGELEGEERLAGRKELGKYVDGEARAVDPLTPVLSAINKSLPKLPPDRPNLVVVVDDLFVSPTTLPPTLLQATVQQYIAAPERRRVSGVLLMVAESYGREVEYRHFLVNNPAGSNALPDAVLRGLLAANSRRGAGSL